MIIAFFLLAIACSIIFALLEIQIEGEDGWASKLPTWKFYRPWFKYIPGGNKPLTGYHFYLWIFLFLYPHLVFLFTPWSLKVELILISFVILVLRLEDFLWFVFNPKYGLKAIKPGKIKWKNQWWGPLPSEYWTWLLLWALVFIIGIKL